MAAGHVPSSIRIRSQACCGILRTCGHSACGTHGVSLRATALNWSRILRITATTAEFPGFPRRRRRSQNRSTSLSWRMTAHADIHSLRRTSPRPPLIARCPRFLPLTRDQGASPTREVKALLSKWPSSWGEQQGLLQLATRCQTLSRRGQRGRRECLGETGHFSYESGQETRRVY